MDAEPRRFVKTSLSPRYYPQHQVLLGLVQEGVPQEFIPWMAEFLLKKYDFFLLF